MSICSRRKWWGHISQRARNSYYASGLCLSPVVECLETRQLLAVDLQVDDLILIRNYRTTGVTADTGFVVVRPSTKESFPLVIPRLNQPGEINYDIGIFRHRLQWRAGTGGEMEPHLIFSGSLVVSPDRPGDLVYGIFDFDINSQTLTSLFQVPRFDSTSGTSYSHGEMAISATGDIVVSASNSFMFSENDFRQSIFNVSRTETFFKQDIRFDEPDPGYVSIISYQQYFPASSLKFDSEDTLYAAFRKDDGFYVYESGVEPTGTSLHPPGIYRLQSGDSPTRTKIFEVPAGEIDFEFAPDGSIFVLVGDVGDSRLSKRDNAVEKLVHLDPVTQLVKTLWICPKKYDVAEFQIDASGRILVSATDNRKDGNTVILDITTGKKKGKSRIFFQEPDEKKPDYLGISEAQFLVVTSIPTFNSTDSFEARVKTRNRKNIHKAHDLHPGVIDSVFADFSMVSIEAGNLQDCLV